MRSHRPSATELMSTISPGKLRESSAPARVAANNSALGFLSRLNDVKTLVGGDLEQEVKKLTNELQVSEP